MQDVGVRETAIITGASSGIGAALVEAAERAGARVATVSRSHLSGRHLSADLSTAEGWSRMADWTEGLVVAATGPVWLFHMAGVLDPIGFAGEVDTDRYRSLVLLDSASPQIVGNDFLAAMIRHDRPGGIVVASSGAATSVYRGWSGYCAAKAAVDQWVRVVGAEVEHRDRNIAVLAVSPGTIETGMQEQIRQTSESDFPQVDRFQQLHDDGQNRSPQWAAERIWKLVHESAIASGSVVDLRDL